MQASNAGLGGGDLARDQHRSFWLRGYYGVLGQAYLTLVPVG